MTKKQPRPAHTYRAARRNASKEAAARAKRLWNLQYEMKQEIENVQVRRRV